MARRVFIFVFITVFLDLVGFGIVLPLLPFYVRTMGGNAQTVGVLFACFSATQLVATPVLGRLSDRFGRRPVILISLAGNAASMVVFALATKLVLLPLLFGSRILAGATAGNLAACQAAVADVTEGTERARGMGQIGAGIGLGLVLGPVAGAWLSEIGPAAPALGAAALALLDFVGALALMPETNANRGGGAAVPSGRGDVSKRRTTAQVLVEPRVVLVLVLYFLVFFAMTALQVAFALLVDKRFGWGARDVGHLFALYGLVMFFVEGVLIGRIARRIGELQAVLLGSVLLGAGMLGVAVSERGATAVAGLVAIAVGLGVDVPMLSSIASTYAGRRSQGAVLGFAQSSGGLARTLGPVCGGWLYARVAPGAPFVASAISAACCVFVALRLRAVGRVSATP